MVTGLVTTSDPFVGVRLIVPVTALSNVIVSASVNALADTTASRKVQLVPLHVPVPASPGVITKNEANTRRSSSVSKIARRRRRLLWRLDPRLRRRATSDRRFRDPRSVGRETRRSRRLEKGIEAI
jgi:hypothetical protein